MAAIDVFEVRHSQAQGQVRLGGGMRVGIRSRDYNYREFDVPYADRVALEADVALGTLFSGDTTGTCTGVKDNGTTTVTATEPSFAAAVDGEDIVIADTGTFAIASRTSTTVIVVTGDATCAGKSFTISGIPGLTAQYVVKEEMVIHRPGEPGRSTIRAWYQGPKWYRPDTTQNVRGKVYIDRKMTWQELTRIDTDGHIFLGPTNTDADDLKGYTWRMEDGGIEIMVPHTKYRLIAAATSAWDPTVIESLVGKLNDATALGSSAGQLLFFGGREEITIRYYGADLRQVELVFLKNPAGWNNILTARRYEKLLIQCAYYKESDGTLVSGPKRIYPRWRKVDASATAFKGYAAADFSLFQAMITL